MLFGNYEFLCDFKSQAVLPEYKGSTFRGVFGHALKSIVCALKHQTCEQCLLKTQCLYPLIFETSVLKKTPEAKNAAAFTHPFVIEPPLNTKNNFRPGDAFNFKLLIFGDINNSLPYLIYAFDHMGELGVGRKINGTRGRFTLKAVRHRGTEIYSHKYKTLNMTARTEKLGIPELKSTTNTISRLNLILETPLRFKQNNRLSDQLPFHMLVRLMLRRISSLFLCCGNSEPALDYPGLVNRSKSVKTIKSNLKWSDWKRYSNRQEQKMNMGGLTGSLTYKGNMEEFMPLLEFCEKVHIGKQTTFGLGKIRKQDAGLHHFLNP